MYSDIFDKSKPSKENPSIEHSLIGRINQVDLEKSIFGNEPVEEEYSQIEFIDEEIDFEEIFRGAST
jgi:hypothetical protein